MPPGRATRPGADRIWALAAPARLAHHLRGRGHSGGTIAETATMLHPSLVVVAAVRAAPLSENAEGLRDLAARLPLAVAGAGADAALASQLGATYLPDGPVEAAARVASVR